MSHAKTVLLKHVPERWIAEIHYRTGPDEITISPVSFEEIGDLEEIVERGPNWNTIDKIEITLNRPSGSG